MYRRILMRLFAGMLSFALMAFVVSTSSAQVTDEEPEVPETEVPETEVPDADVPDTEMPEQPAAEPADADLLTLLENEGTFTMLIGELERTGLADSLANAESYTLFAPTDEAFAAMSDTPEGMTGDELASALHLHIVPGTFTAQQLAEMGEVASLQGTTLPINAEGTSIAGVAIVKADLVTSNGVVHVVDHVIVPKKTPAQ